MRLDHKSLVHTNTLVSKPLIRTRWCSEIILVVVEHPFISKGLLLKLRVLSLPAFVLRHIQSEKQIDEILCFVGGETEPQQNAQIRIGISLALQMYKLYSNRCRHINQ
jgi:hypothetical protein